MRYIGIAMGAMCTKCLGTVCILLCCILVASSAEANVTVGCAGASGGGPFNYPTLTAALLANPTGNVEIDVSGTCTEAVVIHGVQNLSIVGIAPLPTSTRYWKSTIPRMCCAKHVPSGRIP